MSSSALRSSDTALLPRDQAGRACASCAPGHTDEAHEGSLLGLDGDGRPRTVGFPESDFVIRVRHADRAMQPCALVISATVRATPPLLDTWWTEWKVTIEPGTSPDGVADAEVRRARNRFLRLLTESETTTPLRGWSLRAHATRSTAKPSRYQ